MIKRIKRLWELSGSPDILKVKHSAMTVTEAQSLSMRTGKTVIMVDEMDDVVSVYEDMRGDGKAEFLPDMTENEMIAHEHDEVQGWVKVKRALGLI